MIGGGWSLERTRLQADSLLTGKITGKFATFGYVIEEGDRIKTLNVGNFYQLSQF